MEIRAPAFADPAPERLPCVTLAARPALPAPSRMASARPPIHVHKFGGVSLADAGAVRHAARIVAAQRGEGSARRGTVVVVSAMAGVTDALLDMARGVAAGDGRDTASEVEALRRRHADAARSLVPAGDERRDLLRLVDESFRELGVVAGLLEVLVRARHAISRPIIRL